MTYDTLKAAPGAERIDLCEITLEKCSLTNGVAPCVATRTCVNSWATCANKANYSATPFVVKLCTPASSIPDGYVPLMQSVTADSGEPDPETSLGKRDSVSFSFIDAPHNDIGFDPYYATRSYDAMEQGTFWPRFRHRWPFYQGRKVVWRRGFVHAPWDLANFVNREYIAEDLKGWGKGAITLTAKDPLKLADNDRAEYPPRSTGRLAVLLDGTSSHTQIDITTTRTTEYDIQSWEPSYSAVRIGDEIFKYTGVTSIADGVRLTGVTVGGFDQYETTRAAHAVGDEVQKCAYFKAMRPIDVFVVLLEDGAGIDTAYIPYADWLSESTTWIAGFRLTRLVCEPEGVRDTLKELIPQTSTWSLWWDAEASEIKYRVVRPLDLSEIVATVTDTENIVSGSVVCVDESDRLLNEVYITMGQRDPTKDEKQIGNYSEGFVTVNADSQSTNETGSRRSKVIYGRWHPTSNRAELQAVIDRVLLNRSFVPVRLDFEVHRKDDSIQTGDFVAITTQAVTDEFGAKRETQFRVIRSKAGADRVKYTAREDAYASGRIGSFARIAPDTFAAGTEYGDTTADEQAYYMFIAADDGFIDGGIAGKVLL